MTNPTRKPGHQGYLTILDRMRELHIKKDADYAGDARPFDNFRSADEIGVRPSIGAFIRLQDKFKRIQNLLKREGRGIGPSVADESIEDTLLDLSSYALIVLVLRQEEKEDKVEEQGFQPLPVLSQVQSMQAKIDPHTSQALGPPIEVPKVVFDPITQSMKPRDETEDVTPFQWGRMK